MLYENINSTPFLIIATIVNLKNIYSNILPLFKFILWFCFSYHNHIITSRELRNKIIKNINNYYAFTYDENDSPFHTIVDKSLFPKYFIYNDSEDGFELKIFCKNETLKELLSDKYIKEEIKLDDNYVPLLEDENKDKEEINNEDKQITYIASNNSHGNHFFSSRKINLDNINKSFFNNKQDKLFKKIMNFYKLNNYCKVFLSGKPGEGKTFFCYMMAQKLNCYLIDTYDPSDPGTSLSIFYNKTKASASKPIIIVFDEVDIMIQKLHNQEIIKHKYYKNEVENKTTWNNFIDRITFGLFPYVILIMNTNKDKQYIDDKDTAYLRKGRVDIFEKW